MKSPSPITPHTEGKASTLTTVFHSDLSGSRRTLQHRILRVLNRVDHLTHVLLLNIVRLERELHPNAIVHKPWHCGLERKRYCWKQTIPLKINFQIVLALRLVLLENGLNLTNVLHQKPAALSPPRTHGLPPLPKESRTASPRWETQTQW